MIHFEEKKFSQDVWTNLVSRFNGLSMLQTWEFAEAKARVGPWTVERGRFILDRYTVGVVQTLIRKLPVIGSGLVWVNRGPLWHASDVPFDDIIISLRKHYVEQKGFYLRVAPPVNENDLGCSVVTRAGKLGWASSLLDLTLPLETLRAGLKGKWRGHLNKAERNNFEIKSGTEVEFAEFLKAHAAFTEARNFETSVTVEFLETFQDILPTNKKLRAYLAYHSGNLVGSILIARYGSTCEYLAGNTTGQGRQLNAGQILVWRAISDMHEQGLNSFDVSGMDPDLTPKGIYKFKEGIGGTPYRLAPEIEAGGDTIRGRLVRWRVNRARAGK